jgi:SAM-dependent methyltransferase
VPFALHEIVPWGRSFDEYVAMFDLSSADLKARFLGCGDGPASFNFELTRRGGNIVSVDPLYAFSADEIRQRIDDGSAQVMEQTRRNRYQFVWRHIGSAEELGRVRRAAMETFLSDYPSGLAEGRYREASLPELPFGSQQFDVAVCSHLLFLYSEHLSQEFHLRSIRELCRVAREVRVFPLLELSGQESRHLASVVAKLLQDGFAITITKVSYEFQRGGDHMLKVEGRR